MEELMLKLESEYSSENPKKMTEILYKEMCIWEHVGPCCGRIHKWPSNLFYRKGRKTGCPFCTKVKCCPCRSLACVFPTIANDWDICNDFGPDTVSPCSSKEVYWKCIYGHSLKMQIRSRVSFGCKECNYINTKKERDPMIRLKNIRLEYSQENIREFDNISKSANCVWEHVGPCCGEIHRWETSFKKRLDGRDCPFCSRTKCCPCRSIYTLCPNVAREWSENNDFTPDSVSPASRLVVLWKCIKFGHEIEASINIRVQSGCTVCNNRKVNSTNSISLLTDIMKYWDYSKNTLNPEKLKVGSVKKVYWICSKGHSDYRKINAFIIRGKCSYCTGMKLSGEKCLKTTHPKLCKEWSSLNILGPENYSQGSAKKVYWICPKGHSDYFSIINSRTQHKSGCPKCNASKGELMIEKILIKNDINYISEKRISCNNKSLRFDFYLSNYHVAIEFDGEQHFKPVKVFGGESGLNLAKLNDSYKDMYCRDNGISLLRIYYLDMNRKHIEELIKFIITVQFPIKLYSKQYLML
jgi:hypothetical protein